MKAGSSNQVPILCGCRKIFNATSDNLYDLTSAALPDSELIMIRACVGHSQRQSTEDAVKDAASAALQQAGATRADLAMIFFTADHAGHPRELVSSLTHSVGTDCVVGSSGAGVLTGKGEIEGGSGVAVLVIAAEEVVVGPDPTRYRAAIDRFVAAGFTTVYLHQIGPDQVGFLDFCRKELVRHLG